VDGGDGQRGEAVGGAGGLLASLVRQVDPRRSTREDRAGLLGHGVADEHEDGGTRSSPLLAVFDGRGRVGHEPDATYPCVVGLNAIDAARRAVSPIAVIATLPETVPELRSITRRAGMTGWEGELVRRAGDGPLG